MASSFALRWRLSHKELIVPEPKTESSVIFVRRVPLAPIDALVSSKLGPSRVSENCQSAAFNRQDRHVLGETDWRMEYDGDWQVR
ncbi:MAG: hypothetical protein WB676_24560 [Bryobacteraceae bacterium]